MIVRQAVARLKTRPVSPLTRWTTADSSELYGIDRWSGGYFSIGKNGNLQVQPAGENCDKADCIDVKELVDELRSRGIGLPLLLRFSDVLKSRIEQINSAFAKAIAEYEYQGKYRGVYPIKVNQSRTVVEEIVTFGKPFHYGLEAGSKPELVAVLAMHSDPEALIICNGYKDDEYIELALLGSKLNRTIVIVAEKPSEIDQIHSVAERVGVKPTIGIRARLSARGAGRWQESGGDRSKFGFSPAEMLEAVEKLRNWNELDCLRLLHFHLGSQVSAIRSFKVALREAARLYVELYQLGCSGLEILDVGGGLGVDYDGTQSNFASSMNYTMQEYANDVVWTTQGVCEKSGVPHPTLVTEAGRAVAAHHSVLITDVLEVSETANHSVPTEIPDDAPSVAQNLFDIYNGINPRNVLESFHDAVAYKEETLQLFNLSHLSLSMRVLCESLFWAICRKIFEVTKTMPQIPSELSRLKYALSDTYFCNFSLFQSLPDAWAVDQLFPVMPIHRLNEEPNRRGILVDITCDSDGKVDQFISPREIKRVLELHPPVPDQGYFLGFFLVGAYQEILGDLHNLFGDTHAVHISKGKGGSYDIEEVFNGDTVSDVLKYVSYSPQGLVKRVRKHIELAIRKDHMTLAESRNLMNAYNLGLSGYTYLNKESDE